MFLADGEGILLDIRNDSAMYGRAGAMMCTKHNNFCFSLFNFNLLLSIWASISLAQASIWETAAAIPFGVALNETYRIVSIEVVE